MREDNRKTMEISQEQCNDIFDYFGNMRNVADDIKSKYKAVYKLINNLPSLAPSDFPDDKAVNTFGKYELIGLNKWIQRIDGIQPASVAFSMTVNPGGLSGILRAPRYFLIYWTLNGVKLEFAVGRPYPTVSEVFTEFMKVAFSPENVESYKPIRPYPLCISSEDLICRKKYNFKA